MAPLTLVIGNKNYSSWSLRPWLLMKRLDIPLNEVLIGLDTPSTRDNIEKFSPSGRYRCCCRVTCACGTHWRSVNTSRS